MVRERGKQKDIKTKRQMDGERDRGETGRSFAAFMSLYLPDINL